MLPCPCGSEARIDPKVSGTAEWFVITCKAQCGFSLEGVHVYAGAIGSTAEAREKAVTAWNRRTQAGKVVAWLKSWTDDDGSYCSRVDMHDDLDPWMKYLKVEVQPLCLSQAEVVGWRPVMEQLVHAVANMRVPQNTTEAGLQVVVTLGPAFEAAQRFLASPVTVPDAAGETAEQWRENVEALLSSGDPDVIRCHEGGGPESLIGSLVLTMMRTRNARDKALRQSPASQGGGVEVHPDDKAVDAFALRMKVKLKWEREVRDRSGWQVMSAEELSTLLVEHLPKGDPVDVANFCMMLSQNEQRITTQAPPAQQLGKGVTEIDGEAVTDLRRAANALLNQLWQGVYSGTKTFDENWHEMERRFPASKWLQEATAALQPQPVSAALSTPNGSEEE